jgi:nucleoside 2-deoxyribosyltransferase
MNKYKTFYLAGKLHDKPKLNTIINKITTECNLKCTYNWTLIDDHKTHILDIVTHEITGVQSADVLIVIMDDPEYEYRGTFVEIGCALGLNKPILLFNPNELSFASTNIFYFHPNIKHFHNIHELIQELSNQ